MFGQGLVDRSAEQDRSLYTGFETSFSARLPGGAMLFGSWTAEKNTSVFCENDDNPNGPPTGDLYQGRNVARGGRFCDQRNFDMPFLHEFKLAGNYSLPLRRRYRCRRAELRRPRARHPVVAGRDLVPGGQRTQAQTLILTEPGALYGERWDQLDVNFKKNFRYGSKVHTFQLDIFNVFNNNSIRTMNDTVGTRSDRSRRSCRAGSRGWRTSSSGNDDEGKTKNENTNTKTR